MAPGDIVVGDDDGVAVIPAADAERIAAAAEAKHAQRDCDQGRDRRQRLTVSDPQHRVPPWRLALSLHTILTQAVWFGVRLMVSYRAIESGADTAFIAVLAASLAVLPREVVNT